MFTSHISTQPNPFIFTLKEKPLCIW